MEGGGDHVSPHDAAGQPQYYPDAEAAIPGAVSPESEPGNPTSGSHGPGGGGGGGAGASSRPIRRRMRMITSCLECRRRKLKCNKSNPCTNCLKFKRDCLYLGPKLDEASQLRLTEIKEKVGSLERALERDVAKGSRAAKQQRILADDVEDEFIEERDLEATHLVALDITYEEDVDDRDDIIDLGVQVGKMRITERIGGLSRPRISEEVCILAARCLAKRSVVKPPTNGLDHINHKHQISAGISGQRSPPGVGGPMRGPPPGMPPGMPGGPGQFGPPPGMGGGMPPGARGSDGSIPDFLRPGPEYIPPSSGFFFGLTVDTPSLEHLLLPRPTTDRLIQQYFTAVHPIARVVHRPSFEADYENFWDEVYNNYEPRASLQAVVYAAMFSAAVSMDESLINQIGYAKAALLERLKLGTEIALSKASFLRTTRVETMQAFVMYMV
jgi:hypothetical protein